MSLFQQVGLELWKNLLVTKKRKKMLYFTYGFPLIFVLLLAVALFTNDANIDVKHLRSRQRSKLLNNEMKFLVSKLHREPTRSLQIGFCPQTEEISKVMEKTATYMQREVAALVADDKDRNITAEDAYRQLKSAVQTKGFQTEDGLVEYYSTQEGDMTHAVVFTKMQKGFFQFFIRPCYDSSRGCKSVSKSTEDTYPDPIIESTFSDEYNKYGILLLQWLVSKAIMEEWSENKTVTINLTMESMASELGGAAAFKYLFAAFHGAILLLLILPANLIITGTAFEKESGLLEFCKMSGLKTSAHWLSWFVFGFGAVFVIELMFYLLSVLPLGATKYLNEGSASLFLLFMTTFGALMVAFALACTAVFPKSTYAVIGGVFLPVVLPTIRILFPVESFLDKWLHCLSFPFTFYYGFKLIGQYEIQGDGISWSTFNVAPIEEDFTLFYVWLMMNFDVLVFVFIIWYCSNVFPGEYGVPQPYFFFVTKSYWFGTPPSVDSGQEVERQKSSHFAPEPTTLPIGIRICNLRKDFDETTVVNIPDLRVYEGEIFVLLGHNGAGKTVTMSMLSGFLRPTSGTAYLGGKDIQYNLDEVRKTLGLCPQFSVMFDTLTVEENLHFFSKLKSGRVKYAPLEVGDMIMEVGLAEKKNARADTLSGGQKRKLSLAIALINHSRIVILDEPSSGMDPKSRRELWGIISRMREGRTILLTTHFMDEADTLGDRIAIMVQSKIICCGPPLFLKKFYGTGHHLVITKGPQCKTDNVTVFIKDIIKNAELTSVLKLEIRYLLPDKESPKIPDLLRSIDENKEQLGIVEYGVSATTMEEVFLKVNKDVPPIVVEAEEDSEIESEASTVTEASTGIESQQESTRTESAVDLKPFNEPHSGKPQRSQDDEQINDKTVNETIDIEKNEEDGVDLRADSTTDYQRNNTSADWKSVNVEPGKVLRTGRPNSSSGITVQNVSKFQDASKSNVSNNAPDQNEKYENGIGKSSDIFRYEKLEGCALLKSRMWGLVVKKAITTMRNAGIHVLLLALIYSFTVHNAYKASSRSEMGTQPARVFDLEKYSESVEVPFNASEEKDIKALAAMYKGQFSKSVQQSDLREWFKEKAIDIGEFEFRYKYPIGAEFDGADNSSNSSLVQALSWFNDMVYHSQPVSLSYVINAIAKQHSKDESVVIKQGIHPFPKKRLKDQEAAKPPVAIINFFVYISIYFLIKERSHGTKHLQMLAGVSPVLYWVTNLAYDIVICLLALLLILAIYAIFDVESLMADNHMPAMVVVTITFCWSVLPFGYCFSLLFSSPFEGYFCISFLHIFLGLILISMGFFSSKEPEYWSRTIGTLIIPTESYTQCLKNLVERFTQFNFCTKLNYKNVCLQQRSRCCKNYGLGCFPPIGKYKPPCFDPTVATFSWEEPGIARYLLAMAVQGLVFLVLTILTEYISIGQFMSCGGPTEILSADKDDDVEYEKRRIAALSPSQMKEDDPLLLVDLVKNFGSFVAVKGVSVGIQKDECFGLLGQNGAGKSTTFKMLTGQETISSGDIYFNGVSSEEKWNKIPSKMGYCPQFDALPDSLTVEEVLTLFSRLTGVHGAKIEAFVNIFVTKFHLEPHVKKFINKLSGGNKRKVSVAVSLMGDPDVILLDEPSTGVDPEARRQLWDVLAELRAIGKTIILTSHSMEECEALCTRLTIMVNGRMMCLGSPQHLKSKFAQGYTVEVKMTSDEQHNFAPVEAVVRYVQSRLPAAFLLSASEGYCTIRLPDARSAAQGTAPNAWMMQTYPPNLPPVPDVRSTAPGTAPNAWMMQTYPPNLLPVPAAGVPLADLFEVMEQSKQDHGVEAYTVQQTTLEHIFLKMTEKQEFVPRLK